MDQTQKSVIVLLRSAITDQACKLPDHFDLNKVYELMDQHSILPLGYIGACRCGIEKTMPMMQQLFKAYCISTLVSERQLKAANQIFTAFEEEDIDYMPVKGCNLKFLYPSPGLRPMGDADILIHTEQYDKIREIMMKLGYQEGEKTDHCNVWQSKALMVELHLCLIPSGDADFYAYYKDSWQYASYSEGHHWYMTPEDQYIYVLTHFAKHYRGPGIGLSHVLDIWFCRKKYPQMDENYIEGELKKLGLSEFHQNLLRLLTAWFEDGALDDRLEFMSRYIFENGVWGTVDNYQTSVGIKRTVAEGSHKKARLKFWRSAIFPSGKTMEQSYPVLQKSAWLLPLMWIRRWFEILLFRRKNITGKVKEARNISDKKLTEREEMLSYMGLHFKKVEE